MYIRKTYYVYILKCADSSYYTGFTNNLERRLAEHQDGYNKECYTFRRRPVDLVYAVYFSDPNQAIAFEKQVKGWSRAKKEALIGEHWDKIKFLAKCKNLSSHENFGKDG